MTPTSRSTPTYVRGSPRRILLSKLSARTEANSRDGRGACSTATSNSGGLPSNSHAYTNICQTLRMGTPANGSSSQSDAEGSITRTHPEADDLPLPASWHHRTSIPQGGGGSGSQRCHGTSPWRSSLRGPWCAGRDSYGQLSSWRRGGGPARSCGLRHLCVGRFPLRVRQGQFDCGTMRDTHRRIQASA